MHITTIIAPDISSVAYCHADIRSSSLLVPYLVARTGNPLSGLRDRNTAGAAVAGRMETQASENSAAVLPQNPSGASINDRPRRPAAYSSVRLMISSKTGMCLSGRYPQNLTGSTASGDFTPFRSISPLANISTATATGIAV